MKSRGDSPLFKDLKITSLYNKRKVPKEEYKEKTPHIKSDKRPIKLIENEIYNDKETATHINNSSSKHFPKLNYTITNQRNNYSILETNFSYYKMKKNPKLLSNIKKIELFIHPINKSVLEINKFIEIKDNLIKKKFNELHNYKLQINPNNYYHNFGLNEYIEITNNNSKRNKSLDYQYNNISSYNNIMLKKEENKNNSYRGKTKLYKNIIINKKSPNKLKSVPVRINNKKGNNGIIPNLNEDNDTVNANAIWRGKKMNDIIKNKTNLNFFKNFKKNWKYIGKLKTIQQM